MSKRSILVLLLLFSYGYFYNGASWNQNSRLNVIFSFVEPGPDRFSFRIDRFMPDPDRAVNTGDWSEHNGHYYSNKAPGVSLIGIPIYAILYSSQAVFGYKPDQISVAYFNAGIITLFISGIIGAIGALALMRCFVLLGVGESLSTLLSLIMGLCTLYFPYNTQLWGHTTAAALSCVSLYTLLRDAKGDRYWAGFWIGMSVLCDYLAAVNLVFLLLFAARRKQAGGLLLGGLAPLLMLCSYNWICFGSPISHSVSGTNPGFIDPNLVLGVFGELDLSRFWDLTFGSYRGLFSASPILLLSIVGFLLWIRRNRADPLLWCSLGAVSLQLIVNCSFNGWHGGSTIGARYQLATIPFWILPLKEIHLKGALSWIVAAIAGFSAWNMLVITAVSPMVPDDHTNPLYGWTYNLFFEQNFRPQLLPIRLQVLDPNWLQHSKFATWNWGELLGLQGWTSLIPWFCVLLILLAGHYSCKRNN